MRYKLLSPYLYELQELQLIKFRNTRLVEKLRAVNVRHPFFEVNGEGVLAQARYAWDGATGVLLQTEDLMVPSLIHDIGCQAVNLRLLPFSCRALFDDEYRLQCKAYGVPKWRRDMHWGFIRLWGTIRKHEDSPAKYAKVYDFKVLE